LELTITHGYEPWRPVAVGILIILLGYFVFRDAHAAGLLVASQDGSEPSFNPLVYSLDKFLPIVNFNEQEKWQPTDESTKGVLVQWFFWLSITLGWIISTPFVLSFTRLVRAE
jgi:hypothetical protein